MRRHSLFNRWLWLRLRARSRAVNARARFRGGDKARISIRKIIETRHQAGLWIVRLLDRPVIAACVRTVFRAAVWAAVGAVLLTVVITVVMLGLLFG